MREVLFAVALLCAGGLVVTGVALVYLPAAFGAGGVLLALWSWLILSEPRGDVT